MRHDTDKNEPGILPVEDLDLTVSTWKLLRKNRIRTVKDLASLTLSRNWATSILHCGRKSALEIAEALSILDLAGFREVLLSSGLPGKELAKAGNPGAGPLLFCRKTPAQPEMPPALSDPSMLSIQGI